MSNTSAGARLDRLPVSAIHWHVMGVLRTASTLGGITTIARMAANARVARVHGGTNEIMKVVIARSL